jgi:hypothetical protein
MLLLHVLVLLSYIHVLVGGKKVHIYSGNLCGLLLFCLSAIAPVVIALRCCCCCAATDPRSGWWQEGSHLQPQC